MKIVLLTVGKTKEYCLKESINLYVNRLKYYSKFDIIEIHNIKNSKNMSSDKTLLEEGKIILKHLKESDYVVILDSQGKKFSSVAFSEEIQRWIFRGKQLVFVIGGSYGISSEVYKRADFKLSLSRMTFSHQMVRLFFLEQLYRAHTILNNEPYHH